MENCKHKWKSVPVGKAQKTNRAGLVDKKVPIKKVCKICGHEVAHDPMNDSMYLWYLAGSVL
jgi:hypothetical protein